MYPPFLPFVSAIYPYPPQHPEPAHCSQERSRRFHQAISGKCPIPSRRQTRSVQPSSPLTLSPTPRSVTKLNDIRDDSTTYNNRLDTTLADVFSLLSLCYLTLGRTKECPAVYSQLASMRVSAHCLAAFPFHPCALVHSCFEFPQLLLFDAPVTAQY